MEFPIERQESKELLFLGKIYDLNLGKNEFSKSGYATF